MLMMAQASILKINGKFFSDPGERVCVCRSMTMYLEERSILYLDEQDNIKRWSLKCFAAIKLCWYLAQSKKKLKKTGG